MNKCTDSAIREMLPDLLHGTLAADAKGRVEAHLATCEECREELRVLRTVHAAAVFAPRIDVDRVVRQIPPYERIVPPVEVPARSRRLSWAVAATLAVVILGGGSLVVLQRDPAPVPAVGSDAQLPVLLPTQVPPAGSRTPEQASIPSATVGTPAQLPMLALAGDVAELSDVDLAQLMDEMSGFDALPTSEPEPVIAVDSGYANEEE
jgi:anti-sigma factor RsiW